MFAENRVDIPDAIRKRVESKYMKIVGNETVRGKGRKAIVAACLFYVYPEFGEYRTSDYIRGLFELDKKNMSAGLSRYYEVFPEARNLEIRPVDLIRWILTLTGIKISHYRKIVKIAQYLEGSSQLLERSSPQSVASAIVYFYLCLHPKYKHELGLTKNRFADKTMLSDITVGKLVKEAAAVGRCVVAV
jgi:transcription initiation factor TFIIIB Brf1 subunit/transcription initiation factor TFIIB